MNDTEIMLSTIPDECRDVEQDNSYMHRAQYGRPMHVNKYAMQVVKKVKRVNKSRKANKVAAKQRKINRR